MHVESQTQRAGLIPARAGNTSSSVMRCTRSRAHPRSRGEHSTTSYGLGFEPGSSPLARGTLLVLTLETAFFGLIPARAGNTFHAVTSAPLPGAHPRSRGEHMYWLGVGIVALGSSPLARGTRATTICPLHPLGLIPARAGNTLDPLPNRR